MKLTELDPRWIVRDGQRIGFTFISPTNPKCRQSCFRETPPMREQWKLFAETHGAEADDAEWPRDMIQGCAQGTKWQIAGDFFDELTVHPSIDGSKGGNWHGHITNGQIVGGL